MVRSSTVALAALAVSVPCVSSFSLSPSLGLRPTTLAVNSVARQASTGGRIVMASQMDRREAGQMVSVFS
jgi:hypothetical protein